MTEEMIGGYTETEPEGPSHGRDSEQKPQTRRVALASKPKCAQNAVDLPTSLEMLSQVILRYDVRAMRMPHLKAAVLFAGVLLGTAVSAQNLSNQPPHYSTCPDFEHSVVRSVVYVEATKSELIKWAVRTPTPKRTAQPDTVHVLIQVEGQRVFCAQALDGPSHKQKEAVDAAMKWTFKKHRGDFKSYLIGELEFRF